MNALKLESLHEASDRDAFVRAFSAAQALIRRDPYRVGLLPERAWASFLASDSETGAEFWIVHDGDTLVGRIGASLSQSDASTGLIGFFELDPAHPRATDAAARLIEAASAWLISLGARQLYAPVNLNTWLSYRFGLPSDDAERFAWEPVQPPEYVDAFTRAGFTEAMRYRSDACDPESFGRRLRPGFDRALELGFSFRPFDFAGARDAELDRVREMSMVTFSKAFLYSPLDAASFRRLYVPALGAFDTSASRFLLSPDGREVGFMFAFIDDGNLVLKTLALLPEVRGKGISDALVYASHDAARGAKTNVGALVRVGAQSESYIRRVDVVWRHEYCLYGRRLTDA